MQALFDSQIQLEHNPKCNDMRYIKKYREVITTQNCKAQKSLSS